MYSKRIVVACLVSFLLLDAISVVFADNFPKIKNLEITPKEIQTKGLIHIRADVSDDIGLAEAYLYVGPWIGNTHKAYNPNWNPPYGDKTYHVDIPYQVPSNYGSNEDILHVKLCVKDTSGQVTQSKYYRIVITPDQPSDKDKPVLSNSSVAPSSGPPGTTFTLEVRAKDNIGVENVTGRIDLGHGMMEFIYLDLYKGTPQSGYWRGEYHSPTSIPKGKYTVNFYAIDEAANSIIGAETSFRIVMQQEGEEEEPNSPPAVLRVDPSDEIVELTEAGDTITFKVQASDKDANPDMDLRMIKWYVDNVWKETDPADGTSSTGEFTFAFEELKTYYVRATVYDEKMEKSSVTWKVVVSVSLVSDVLEGYVYIEQESTMDITGNFCQGKLLEGALIEVVGFPSLSTRTDSNGYFKIQLPTELTQTKYEIRISRLYYKTKTMNLGPGSPPTPVRIQLRFYPEFSAPESSWWNHKLFDDSVLKTEFPDVYDDLGSRDSLILHPILNAEWRFVGDIEKYREDVEIELITYIPLVVSGVGISKAAWNGKFSGGLIPGVKEFLRAVGWEVLWNLISPEDNLIDIIVNWDEWPNYATMGSPDGNAYLLFVTTDWGKCCNDVPGLIDTPVIGECYRVTKTYLYYLTGTGWQLSTVVPAYEAVTSPPGSLIKSSHNELTFDSKWALYGAANLHIYDSEGNHVGVTPSGSVVTEIPNVYYSGHNVYPEMVIILDSSESMNISVKGTGQGTFDLIGQVSIAGTITLVEYKQVPITRNTIAWIDIDPSNLDYTLRVDEDGDGNTDFTVQPTSTLMDSDNDGTPDSQDQCTHEPGPPENRGCPTSESTGTIVVYVRDDSRNDVPGATVYLDGEYQGTTNEEGYLRIEDVPEGAHVVSASKSKYDDNSTEVRVQAGKTETVYLTLKEESQAKEPSLTLYAPDVDGLAVTINGVTNPGTSGATITRIHWEWGDGSSEDQWFPASHTYREAETYTVTVTSYQSDGLSTTKTVTVNLKEDKKPGTIEVYVTDDSQSGLSEANVYLDSAFKGRTDSNGYLRIDDVVEGNHVVKASKFGYAEDSKEVYVTAGKTETVRLHLSGPSTGEIKVYVKDNHGTGIKEASVYLDGEYQKDTDRKGYTRLVNVPEGYHTITASKPGYEDASETVYLGAGEKETVYLYLSGPPPTGTIKVFVRDESDNRLSGAKVYLDGSYQGETNRSGYLLIENVPQGDHTVMASKSGYKDDSRKVSVEAGKSVEVDLCLVGPPRGTIKVYVTDDDENDLPGANVYLDGRYQGTTDEEGYLLINNVPEGHYTVKASMSGYADDSKEVYVKAGEIERAYLELERMVKTGSLEVYVTDYFGNMLSGANVYLDNVYQGKTGGGYLRIDDVPEGHHTVTASMSGYKDASTTVSVVAGSATQVHLQLEKEVEDLYLELWTDRGCGSTYKEGEQITIYYRANRDCLINLIDDTPSEGSDFIERKQVVGGQTYSVSRTLRGAGTHKLFLAADDKSAQCIIYVEEAGPQTGGILVYVTDDSGSGLSGAKVYLDGSYQGETSVRGDFRIDNVPEGNHTLGASLSGYKDASTTVYVTAGSTVQVHLQLEKVMEELQLELWTDKGCGSTYKEGDQITLYYRANRDCFIGLGEAYGGGASFLERNQVIGGQTYSYSKVLKGAGTHEFVIVAEDKSAQCIVYVEGSPQIGGIEVYANLSGASVYLDGAHKGNTDRGGYLKIDNVPEGQHTVVASMPGFIDASANIYVPAGKTVQVHLQLEREVKTGAIEVYVMDTSRTMLSGANVYLDGAQKGVTERGYLKIDNVPEGNHTLGASLSGYKDASTTVYVTAGSTVQVHLQLEKVMEELQLELWTDKGCGSTYKEGDQITLYYRANRDCFIGLGEAYGGGASFLERNQVIGGQTYSYSKVLKGAGTHEFVIVAEDKSAQCIVYVEEATPSILLLSNVNAPGLWSRINRGVLLAKILLPLIPLLQRIPHIFG